MLPTLTWIAKAVLTVFVGGLVFVIVGVIVVDALDRLATKLWRS